MSKLSQSTCLNQSTVGHATGFTGLIAFATHILTSKFQVKVHLVQLLKPLPTSTILSLPTILQLVYSYLQSIPPTSVEAKRAFLATGMLCTRIRSSLTEATMDTLCFLRTRQVSSVDVNEYWCKVSDKQNS